MGEPSITLPVAQLPVSWIWKILCWLPRKLTGTDAIQRNLEALTTQVSAVTEVTHMVLADVSAKRTQDKRERAQRAIANFTIIKEGLNSIKPQGNPFTSDELQRVRQYTLRAQQGQPFSPAEAQDYRDLSERAANEYSGQDWAEGLLALGIFVFAVYALSEMLKPKDKE